MKAKKILFIVLGCIGLGLGAVGAVVPLLPAFPFLLLAAYSFARSSERLHSWFINTKLYKNNLESYVKGKGMTKRTKVRIMITVTVLMTFGFVMMHQVPVGRIVLAAVWLFHIFYFAFGVKTLKEPAEYTGCAFTHILHGFAAFCVAWTRRAAYNKSRTKYIRIAAQLPGAEACRRDGGRGRPGKCAARPGNPALLTYARPAAGSACRRGVSAFFKIFSKRTRQAAGHSVYW